MYWREEREERSVQDEEEYEKEREMEGSRFKLEEWLSHLFFLSEGGILWKKEKDGEKRKGEMG